jgi:hypothetical protein
MDSNPLDAVKGNLFKNLPKPVLYGGIAVTVAVTGYLLYKHKQSTGSWFGGSTGTTSAGSPTAIDPVTGLAYSQDNVTDPITGETYLAEATQYGSVASAEAAVSSYGQTSQTGTGVGVPPDGTAGVTETSTGATSVSTYTSDAAWAQAAIAGLEDISGGPSYNGTDIATAIGDYLQGEPITAAQIQVVNVALSEFPIPSPIPVIQKPTAPAGTTQVTVPTAKGVSVEEGSPLFTEKGLKVAISPNTNPGPVRIIQSTTPAAGVKVNPGSTVTLHWTAEVTPKKGK